MYKRMTLDDVLYILQDSYLSDGVFCSECKSYDNLTIHGHRLVRLVLMLCGAVLDTEGRSVDCDKPIINSAFADIKPGDVVFYVFFGPESGNAKRGRVGHVVLDRDDEFILVGGEKFSVATGRSNKAQIMFWQPK